MEKLNASWNKAYGSFAQASAALNLLNKTAAAIAKHIDLQEFLHGYVVSCAGGVMDEYKKNGINSPAVINCYTSFRIQDPVKLTELADIVGLDVYPAADFKAYKDEFKDYLEWLRCTDFISKVPYLAESQSGIWYGRHHEAGGFRAKNYRLKDLAALACGIKGFNWYMLVNRDNWQEAPITEQNQIQPEIFEVFKSLIKVCSRLDLPSLKSTANVALTFDSASFHQKTDLSDDVLKAVYEADVDYRWFPFSESRPLAKLLFYASEDWLSLTKQNKLYNYVRQGGNLVFLETPVFTMKNCGPIISSA